MAPQTQIADRRVIHRFAWVARPSEAPMEERLSRRDLASTI